MSGGFWLRVACDLYGQKVNTAFRFRGKPCLTELSNAVETYFDVRSRCSRPAGYPDVAFELESLHYIDPASGAWTCIEEEEIPVREEAQLWAFQPPSLWNSDAQGVLPAPERADALAAVAGWTTTEGSIHRTRAAVPGQVNTPPLHDRVAGVFKQMDSEDRGQLNRIALSAALAAADLQLQTYDSATLYDAIVDQDGQADWHSWVSFALRNPVFVDALYFRLCTPASPSPARGRSAEPTQRDCGLVSPMPPPLPAAIQVFHPPEHEHTPADSMFSPERPWAAVTQPTRTGAAPSPVRSVSRGRGEGARVSPVRSSREDVGQVVQQPPLSIPARVPVATVMPTLSAVVVSQHTIPEAVPVVAPVSAEPSPSPERVDRGAQASVEPPVASAALSVSPGRVDRAAQAAAEPPVATAVPLPAATDAASQSDFRTEHTADESMQESSLLVAEPASMRISEDERLPAAGADPGYRGWWEKSKRTDRRQPYSPRRHSPLQRSVASRAVSSPRPTSPQQSPAGAPSVSPRRGQSGKSTRASPLRSAARSDPNSIVCPSISECGALFVSDTDGDVSRFDAGPDGLLFTPRGEGAPVSVQKIDYSQSSCKLRVNDEWWMVLRPGAEHSVLAGLRELSAACRPRQQQQQQQQQQQPWPPAAAAAAADADAASREALLRLPEHVRSAAAAASGGKDVWRRLSWHERFQRACSMIGELTVAPPVPRATPVDATLPQRASTQAVPYGWPGVVAAPVQQQQQQQQVCVPAPAPATLVYATRVGEAAKPAAKRQQHRPALSDMEVGLFGGGSWSITA